MVLIIPCLFGGLAGCGRVQPLPRARQLLLTVGFFLRDLLSFADRGQCFLLIRTVFRSARLLALLAWLLLTRTFRALRLLHQPPTPGIVVTAGELTAARLDILRVLGSHEHFVALNLPLASLAEPEVKLSF